MGSCPKPPRVNKWPLLHQANQRCSSFWHGCMMWALALWHWMAWTCGTWSWRWGLICVLAPLLHARRQPALLPGSALRHKLKPQRHMSLAMWYAWTWKCFVLFAKMLGCLQRSSLGHCQPWIQWHACTWKCFALFAKMLGCLRRSSLAPCQQWIKAQLCRLVLYQAGHVLGVWEARGQPAPAATKALEKPHNLSLVSWLPIRRHCARR